MVLFSTVDKTVITMQPSVSKSLSAEWREEGLRTLVAVPEEPLQFPRLKWRVTSTINFSSKRPSDLFWYLLTLTGSQLYIVFKSLCIFKSPSSNLGCFSPQGHRCLRKEKTDVATIGWMTEGPHKHVQFLSEIQKQWTKKESLENKDRSHIHLP